MIPTRLRAATVTERVGWIKQMLAGAGLPADVETFRADPRNLAAAESYLRRCLEALLDLGRHVLAKGFGQAVIEYKEIAIALTAAGVLNQAEGRLLRDLAGYRNRLVHFYDEVSEQELYEIVTQRLSDVELILAAIIGWIRRHPESIDHRL